MRGVRNASADEGSASVARNLYSPENFFKASREFTEKVIEHIKNKPSYQRFLPSFGPADFVAKCKMKIFLLWQGFMRYNIKQ